MTQIIIQGILFILSVISWKYFGDNKVKLFCSGAIFGLLINSIIIQVV